MGAHATISVGIKTHMEGHLWDLANEHANDAAQAETDKERLQASVATIILTVACLESFINGELIEFGFPEDQLWNELQDKWVSAVSRLGGSISKGHQPLQGLKWLAGLRNELIHYRPRYETPVHTPEGIKSPAEERYTPAVAAKAIQVATELLEQYAMLQGYPWPWKRD